MPHVRSLLVALALTLSLGAYADAPRHPITHEDVWLMKRVGVPVASPDGRHLVVSVVDPAYDPKEQASDLWIVATDGTTPPRPLTFTKGPESGVTFSADGTRIAFATKREGDAEPQIYVLDLAQGGEAQRLTDAPLGAHSPRFSPDGASIAYVTDVWRGAKDPADNRRLTRAQAERKSNVRSYEGFPIRSWDHWLDEREPHLYVQEARAGAPARDLLAGTALVAHPGFGGRSEDDGTTLEPVWTPDGQGLVFVAGIDHDEAAHAFTSTQLWWVGRDGGEPVALTSGKDSWTTPRFAKTGDRLYAEHSRATGHVYAVTRLAVMPFDKGHVGASTDLTTALDRSVGTWGVTADGTLYFLAEDAGHEQLYRATPDGVVTSPVPLVHGAYTGLSVTDGGALYARYESSTEPAELVRIDLSRGPAPLTSFNTARAATIDWQPVEEFWFKNAKSRDIHSFLIKPPGFDPNKKYPLFVVIHGGAASMWRDQFVLRWNYHLLAAGGYVVLLTDYTGSTGYGEDFTVAIERDPLKGPAEDINAAADEAIRRYAFIDGERQCAGGASYGGHLTNWMEASTTRYRCLVSHAGLVNLEHQWGTSDGVYHREVTIGSPPWQNDPMWREQSPIHYAEQFKTPILLSIGEHDFRVPINNTLEFWTALQRQQVPSRLLVFPDANHWILRGEDSRAFYSEVAAWLGKYLGSSHGGTPNP